MIRVENGVPRHYPDGGSFQFDDEVASIFPDMASRSIPLYHEMHALHAEIASDFLYASSDSPRLPRLIDVGASRGQFFLSLHRAVWPTVGYETDMSLLARAVSCVALENSAPMIGHLRSEFPEIETVEADLSNEEGTKELGQFDVVVCHYVLQFIPSPQVSVAIRNLLALCRPGGLLLYAEKHGYGFWGKEASCVPGAIAANYYRWRGQNGYTATEIEAKTEALKGSMFERGTAFVDGALAGKFSRKFDTFRFGQFRGFAAIKNR